MLLEASQVIDGKYRIVRLIGTGGMGGVYEGENILIRRRVAIKVLNAASAGNADVIRRFEREAQAAGEIGNDHILEVLDLGSLPSGDRYLVMEYLDGETLAARIERHGRLTPGQIAPLARQFLTALASAHAAGIIHRDLKPENIFILRSKAGRADFVKLIDFGISKFSRPFKEGEMRMTRADAIFGTPCYMSPEQARGAAEADVRSDIYSCGVILYESVTGRLPFEGDSFNDLMFKIALSEAPSPLSFVPSLDPDFAWIIQKAISRDPNDRFASVQEFAEKLDDWMRKNALTETMAQPSPSDAFPARAPLSPLRASGADPETISPDAMPQTGTAESWAHSQPLALVRNKRGAKIAAASVVLLAIVGFVVALAVRAAPARSPAREPPAAPVASVGLPAAPPAAVSSTLGTQAVPGAASYEALSPEKTNASPAPRPRGESASKPAPAAHPPAAPPAGARPKPAPPTTPAKGFDLGY
jgi:serine/threonine protein kinase